MRFVETTWKQVGLNWETKVKNSEQKSKISNKVSYFNPEKRIYVLKAFGVQSSSLVYSITKAPNLSGLSLYLNCPWKLSWKHFSHHHRS